MIVFAVPTPQRTTQHRDAGILSNYIKPVLKEATLLRMNASVFILHLLMTANFSVLPLIFRDHLQFKTADHWMIYLPVLAVSLIFSLPLIIIAEKYRKIKIVFILTVVLLIISQTILSLFPFDFYPLMGAFLLFFIGFNFLEAVQPSLVAKYSDVNTKGTAMGVYSTAQFLGIFVGGIIGGLVLQNWGISGVFVFSALMAILLLVIAMSLPRPDFFKTHLIKLKDEFINQPEKTQTQLLAISGVKQAAVSVNEGLAYLKIDKDYLDQVGLEHFSPKS